MKIFVTGASGAIGGAIMQMGTKYSNGFLSMTAGIRCAPVVAATLQRNLPCMLSSVSCSVSCC